MAGRFRSGAEDGSASGTPKSLVFAIVSQKAAQIIKKKNSGIQPNSYLNALYGGK